MEQEISMKELLLILMKGWKIILSIIFVTLVLGVISINFLNTTTYVGELKGQLKVPNDYKTVYGQYELNEITLDSFLLPIRSNDFNRVINNDSGVTVSITVQNENMFSIQFSAENQNAVTSIMSSVQSNLEDYLNFTLQTSAINRFQRIIQIEVDRETKNIATNQGILERFNEKISQTESLLNTANINPAYEVIQREITSLELSILRSLENIETLKFDYDSLETYRYASYDEYKNSSNHFDQVSVDLTLNSDIIVNPVNRFNPPMMVAISGILGLMLGIFIVFFIQYWKSN